MSFSLLLACFILIASLCTKSLGIDESLVEKDLYKVLGLSKESSGKEIKKAYRRLAQVDTVSVHCCVHVT